jgi:hypothetical protein
MLTRRDLILVILFSGSINLLHSPCAHGKTNYDYLPQDEVTSIEVEGQPLPVLVRPWEGKLRLGSVIIIGPSDSNADAAGFISHLRKSLNPAGWASISLTPPKGLYRPSFATGAEEIAKVGGEQLSVSGYKPIPLYNSAQLLELRNFQQEALTKSFAPLEALSDSYAGLKMYLVSDDSAGILISLLFDKKIPAPDVLVLINPYREHEELIDEPSRRKSIAQQLLMQTFPVLDLQSPNGHPVSLANAHQRKAVNQLKSPRLYRQYRLNLRLDNPSGWEEAQNYIEGFARFATGN